MRTSYIRYLNVAAKSFELKLSVLNYLISFYGRENEDSYNHLNDFYIVCKSFKYENSSDEDVELRLFLFSLKVRVCSWFNILSANSIIS